MQDSKQDITNNRADSRDRRSILWAIGLLVIFGLMMIYSTSAIKATELYGSQFHYLERQLLAAVIGSVAAFSVIKLPYAWLRFLPIVAFPLAVTLLILVMIPGLGYSAGGARRWLRIGGFPFQPGEVVKILSPFIVIFAFQKMQSDLKRVCLAFSMLSCLAVLLLMQPDYGTTAVIFISAFGLLFVLGCNLRLLLSMAAVGISAGALLIISSAYRRERVLAFFSPMSDPQGDSYQLLQSLIAVGSGGWFGRGLGASKQKLFFLPEAHTDFIFAVIAEELGFVGAAAIVCVFLFLLFRFYKVAEKTRFDQLAYGGIAGLAILLLVQAALNFGVVLGLLPTKGLVLPFVAYGGSNLICSLIAIGLVIKLATK